MASTANRSELCKVAAALEQRTQPCGDEAVVAVLTPMVTLYGIAQKAPAEWRVFWRFYIDALKGLPIEALQNGVVDYVARSDSEFFPKPGPLKSICAKHAEEMLTALGRARRAMTLDPNSMEVRGYVG